ncbi:expressed unknown protein [Seminavis robusta]|uniref:Uncharacterized protein n=1 Tax=Seminavis robusta TaxID=568900 RepID=A0A9N8EI14_9STRA|nr:expressed unknown protein [Seminavis robusta]|eukprot:Sro1167_g248370.1 n/a (103) ;mRNA; r:13045-13353
MTSIHRGTNTANGANNNMKLSSETPASFASGGLVQQRKDKLEEVCAAQRGLKIVKKSKWHVGGSGYGSGVYKKKTVVRFEDSNGNKVVPLVKNIAKNYGKKE